MLIEKEISRINELIKKGKSDYKIGRELGHSPNTIKKIREGYKEAEEGQILGEVMHFNSSIDVMRNLISYMGNYLKYGQLKDEERKEWEKRLGQMREMLRVEVDERIPDEIANAVNLRDDQWREIIQRDYVDKEIVSDLNIRKDELNNNISYLKISNNDKDEFLIKKQSEIFQLKDDKQREKETLMNQIYDLSRENDGLWYENSRLQNVSINRDYDMSRQQETLKLKTEFLDVKEIKLKKDEEAKQLKFNKLSRKLDENIEAVEIREKNVSMREDALNEKIKRTNDESDKAQCRIKHDQEQINMDRADIEKIREQQKIEAQRLQKWQTLLEKTGGFNKFALPCKSCKSPMLFDVTDPETNQKISRIFGNYIHAECIKKKKRVFVILHPVLSSGEPVVRSGFSPAIQSGAGVNVFGSSGEPVIQSGL